MRAILRRSKSPGRRKQKTADELIKEVKEKETTYLKRLTVQNKASDNELERAPSLISRVSCTSRAVREEAVKPLQAEHKPPHKTKRGRSLSKLFRRRPSSVSLEGSVEEPEEQPDSSWASLSAIPNASNRSSVPAAPVAVASLIDLGESDINDVQSALREMEKELKVAKRRGRTISRAKVMDALLQVVDSLENENGELEEEANAAVKKATSPPPALAETTPSSEGGTIASRSHEESTTITRNRSKGSDSGSSATSYTGTYNTYDDRTYDGSLGTSTYATQDKDVGMMKGTGFHQIGQLFQTWSEDHSEESSDDGSDDRSDDRTDDRTADQVEEEPAATTMGKMFGAWRPKDGGSDDRSDEPPATATMGNMFGSWNKKSELPLEKKVEEEAVATTNAIGQTFPSWSTKVESTDVKGTEVKKREEAAANINSMSQIKRSWSSKSSASEVTHTGPSKLESLSRHNSLDLMIGNVRSNSLTSSTGMEYREAYAEAAYADNRLEPLSPERVRGCGVVVQRSGCTSVELPDLSSWLNLGDNEVKKLWNDLLWVTPSKQQATDLKSAGQNKQSTSPQKVYSRDSIDEIVRMRSRNDIWSPTTYPVVSSPTASSTPSAGNSANSPEKQKKVGQTRSWFRRVKSNSKLDGVNSSRKGFPTNIIICDLSSEESRVESPFGNYEEDEIIPSPVHNFDNTNPTKRRYRPSNGSRPPVVM